MDIIVLKHIKHQFLLINLIGWIGYCLSSSLGLYYWDKPSGYYYLTLLGSVLGFLITLVLRIIYRRHVNRSILFVITCVLVICYLATLIWVLPVNIVYYQVLNTGPGPNSWIDYFMSGSRMFYVLVCWSCLYFGLKFYRAMEYAKERELKANALAHQSQLKMLRYQLNPHFLFNTLNAISTLVLDNSTQRANEMVVRLSNFLRHSLDNDPMQKVTLEQEVHTLELYLGIEKVRFEDHLKLDFQLANDAKDALIPSLILQPLVENSIKYAITQSEQGGSIKFRADILNDRLRMVLSDDGPGVSLDEQQQLKSRGVGINNTRERLKQLYADRHSFTLSSVDPHGLQVEIQLPFETVQKEEDF